MCLDHLVRPGNVGAGQRVMGPRLSTRSLIAGGAARGHVIGRAHVDMSGHVRGVSRRELAQMVVLMPSSDHTLNC